MFLENVQGLGDIRPLLYAQIWGLVWWSSKRLFSLSQFDNPIPRSEKWLVTRIEETGLVVMVQGMPLASSLHIHWIFLLLWMMTFVVVTLIIIELFICHSVRQQPVNNIFLSHQISISHQLRVNQQYFWVKYTNGPSTCPQVPLKFTNLQNQNLAPWTF